MWEKIKKYNIGSEGGSAWVWLGPNPNDMVCIGYTAPTQEEAIQKVIDHIEEVRAAC